MSNGEVERHGCCSGKKLCGVFRFIGNGEVRDVMKHGSTKRAGWEGSKEGLVPPPSLNTVYLVHLNCLGSIKYR